MIASIVILLLVTAERLASLVIGVRNSRKLLAKGGVESGAEHFPLIMGLHAAWLVGLWVLAWDRPVHWGWALAYLPLTAARIWVVRTLGERWTSRIIVLPGVPPVRTGPYRYLAHPNYVVMVAEVFVMPIAFGLTAYALVFVLLNASVLWIRIRMEERALAAAMEP